MNINDIQTAVKEGIPFLIRMADGGKYEVADPLKIALGKTRIVVIDKHDLAHVLPLLTITGISYLKPAK